MTYSTPHETASELGITPATLRRWSEYHSIYLSSGAQPNAGQARRFTGKDLEVLRYCKSLRDQGQTVSNINEQLSGLTFAEIDKPTTDLSNPEIDASREDTILTIVDALDTHQETPSNVLIISTLDAIQRRLEAVEQAKVNDRRLVRDGVFMFLAGGVTVLLIVLIIIVVVNLWAK